MPKPRWQIISAFILCGMILRTLFVSAEPAHPDWWDDQGVTNDNDTENLAVANLGQLKHVVNQAHATLEAVFPTGAPKPFIVPVNPDAVWYETQKKALNLGQLKAVAKPIYDNLNEISPNWVKSQFCLLYTSPSPRDRG